MNFRVNLTVEVDQVANALAIQTPVPIQLDYSRGKWQGRCDSVPVTTDKLDSMEEALVACARQVAAEAQMAVEDRPVIAGRITPADVLHVFG